MGSGLLIPLLWSMRRRLCDFALATHPSFTPPAPMVFKPRSFGSIVSALGSWRVYGYGVFHRGEFTSYLVVTDGISALDQFHARVPGPVLYVPRSFSSSRRLEGAPLLSEGFSVIRRPARQIHSTIPFGGGLISIRLPTPPYPHIQQGKPLLYGFPKRLTGGRRGQKPSSSSSRGPKDTECRLK